LTYCFNCYAASLAAAIRGGALVWTMSFEPKKRYRRCAPTFSEMGKQVFKVP
jgi:hypothetical protein